MVAGTPLAAGTVSRLPLEAAAAVAVEVASQAIGETDRFILPLIGED